MSCLSILGPLNPPEAEKVAETSEAALVLHIPLKTKRGLHLSALQGEGVKYAAATHIS